MDSKRQMDLANKIVGAKELEWLNSLPSGMYDRLLIPRDIQLDTDQTLGRAEEFNRLVVRWGSDIVKVSTVIPDFDDDVNAELHEGFLGFHGINQLAATVPNFSRIVGIVAGQCLLSGSPLGVPPHDAYMYRNEDDQCYYVGYQLIVGTPLKEWMYTSSLQQFVDVVSQILFALHTAYHQIGFTHYDLHCNNVIVQHGSVTPVLIDYGVSHITYNGEDYGFEMKDGSIHNKAFWMHDVKKILMMMYYFLSPEIVRHVATSEYDDDIEVITETVDIDYLVGTFSSVREYYESTINIEDGYGDDEDEPDISVMQDLAIREVQGYLDTKLDKVAETQAHGDFLRQCLTALLQRDVDPQYVLDYAQQHPYFETPYDPELANPNKFTEFIERYKLLVNVNV